MKSTSTGYAAMSLPARVQLGAASAMLGGLFWIVKAGTILLIGEQPPFLFELAPILFAGGLLGLHARAGGKGGVVGNIGLGLAIVSGVAAVITLMTTSPSAGESFSPPIFITFLAELASLVFLGLAARRTRAIRWSLLPLTLGTITFPLIALGGALATVNARLLEIPILLLGLAWVWLGYAIRPSSSGATPGTTGAQQLARP